MKSALIFTPIYCVAIYLIFAFLNYDWMWMRFIPNNTMIRLCLLCSLLPMAWGIGYFIEDSHLVKQVNKLK